MSSPEGKIVSFTSVHNGKILRYVKEDIEAHGFLQYSGNEYLSCYTKFEVVPANITGSSYVHIRCVYNNRYWMRSAYDNYLIFAGADEVNEDQHSWNCTLFEILDTNQKPNRVRIRHVQLGCYLSLRRASALYEHCLFAASPDIGDDLRDQVEWKDIGSLFVLPKFIAFKNPSGAYLGAKMINGMEHLQFSSNDIEDETVMHEATSLPWGGHYILSSYFSKYWDTFVDGYVSAWILAEASTPDDSDQPKFWVFDAGENAVAIQTYEDNYYCKEHNSGNITNCLYALESTTFDEAKLQVEEPLSGRSIYNIEYHQSDARYYDKKKVLLDEKTATNRNNIPIDVEYSLSYPTSTSKTWKSTNSRKPFKNVSIEAKLPKILSANTDILGNVWQEYNWEEPITTTSERAVFSVSVPPNSTVTISFFAIHTWGDIPFTYTQDDTLLNGNKITTQFEDGLFTITNNVHFNYEIA